MARIRSIKPEFWTSEQIMECSPIARLMFVGLWNFADDAGRMVFSVKAIKARLFPSDDISPETILGLIRELSTNGLIILYTIEGKEYLAVTGWHHQRIDKPQKSKIPAPSPASSKNVPRSFDLGMDRRGEEGNGEERKKDAASAAPASPASVDQDADLFRRGKEVLGPTAGGLVAKLKTHHGGSVPKTRATIEHASTKQDPREYVGRVLKKREDEDARWHDPNHPLSGIV